MVYLRDNVENQEKETVCNHTSYIQLIRELLDYT